ncbi:hypothetical protein H9P43_007391 [Blastocladiella emersonii ATCC 22665]|nr:hypothetical protein H9P43_007391 [Blastocladiella emersonii ATCC 22665]
MDQPLESRPTDLVQPAAAPAPVPVPGPTIAALPVELVCIVLELAIPGALIPAAHSAFRNAARNRTVKRCWTGTSSPMANMLAAVEVVGLLNRAEWTAIIRRGLVQKKTTGKETFRPEFVASQLGDTYIEVLKSIFEDSIIKFETDPLDILCLAHAHLGDGEKLSSFFQSAIGLFKTHERYTGLVIKQVLDALFRPCPRKPLWTLFLFANEMLVRNELLSYPAALAWIPVAVLYDRKLSPKAVDVMRDTTTAWRFVTVMLDAQAEGTVGARAVNLSPRRKSCSTCALSSQRAWLDTLAKLFTSFPGMLDKIPAATINALLAKMGTLPGPAPSQPAAAPAATTPIAPAPAACPVTATPCTKVDNPHLELVQLLICMDLDAMIRKFSGAAGNGTGDTANEKPPPPAFWRAVPDGALDGVRHAAWIARAVHELKVGGKLSQVEAQAAIRDIRRVAPIAVASREFADAMVAIHTGDMF